MALPSLNAAPQYELTVPSTGQQLNYRPFLVKEQKVLMLAHESQDKKQVINAMMNTIKSCVEDVDTNRLTTFDVDYIFTQLRAKSVGEKIDFQIPCDECETKLPYQVNIEKIKIEGSKAEKVVELNDKVSVRLRYPSYNDVLKVMSTDSKTQTETVIDVIAACMDAVLTDEESISLKNETREEINNFIDSMSGKQFEDISEFVQDMPQMEYKGNVKCPNCGHNQRIELKGLDDFF